MARILLAEDDPSLRRFLRLVLQRAGHQVEAFGDGAAAWAAIRGMPFDLLVADVVMPGLDGIELARRAVTHRPSLRIMVITGFAAVTMTVRPTGRDARLLSKPFHLRNLIREVDKVLAA